MRELLLWGGGTAVLILGCWWYAGSLAGGTANQAAALAPEHDAYRRYYVDGAPRVPAEQARQSLKAAASSQAEELRTIEAAVLTRLPDELLRPGFGYVHAVARANEAAARLRNRGERMNLRNLPNLPHLGPEAVPRGDSPAELARRSYLLCEVWLAERMMTRLLDLSPRNMSALAPVGLQRVEQDYALLTCAFVATFDSAAGQRLLEQLREHEGGLLLRRLDYTVRDNNQVEISGELAICTAWPALWNGDPSLGGAPAAPKGAIPPRRR
jgi:hypothetical protein